MEGQIDETKRNQYISSARGCCAVQIEGKYQLKVSQQKCCKLSSYNWLENFHEAEGKQVNIAEIRFKNGRKDFYSIPSEIVLKDGELVAVEASPGHDIGIVSLTGDAVNLQMKRKHVDPERKELKRVFRHARPADVEKWLDALAIEDSSLRKTRVIAMDLGLEMKINDVEYQGDRTKAIFYYTANERVDFRELIKRLAEAFRIRIEMRQIGVRQEAAKLGGIGSCGRELCCSSWMSNFHSVSTNSARLQNISLNPQKLAGQCGKLKCCLNYELDTYVEAQKDFPDSRQRLNTKKGIAFHQKTDVIKGIMWYAYADDSNNMMAIPVDEVRKIIAMNKNGKLPAELEEFAQLKEPKVNVENEGGDDYPSFF